MSELKTQIKEELLKQKEEKLKVERELNSKLKEITLYTKPKNPVCEQYKTAFTDLGIKFKEETINKQVLGTVQQNAIPVIHVNDNWIVHSRDCNNAKQCLGIIRHFADPSYVNPPFEDRLFEALKNLNMSINKNIQGLNRQLRPVIDVMQSITKEIQEENKPKAGPKQKDA